MSHKQILNAKKCTGSLVNEKPTRKSARLINNCPKISLQLERKTRSRLLRKTKTCPVFTRSKGACVKLYKSDMCESTVAITDENSTEDTTDSDSNFIKTLTFSSSDSTASKQNSTSKRYKVLDSSYDQRLFDKKRLNNLRQNSEKEHADTLNGEVLRSLTNQNGYNLRSKSQRVAKPFHGSETSSTNEEKNVVDQKLQNTKFKERKNENNKEHTSKVQALKKIVKPSSLSWDKEKYLKKSKGTLARKRELRAMLEQQDEGYEDDAFEGTPFRYRKPFPMYKLSPVILDTSIQSVSTTDTEFNTPSSRTPSNRLRPAGPLSTGTSESDIMTPGLLNSVKRSDIDRYVNILKRRKFRPGYKKSHTPLSKKHSRIIQTKYSIDFDTNSSVPEKSTTESENGEEDYYWSDIE